jgi:hypothetical protein
MKTKHTKGEWTVTPNGEWVGTLGKGKAPICKITNGFLEPTEAKANAKLIAAAPELLNALSFLLNDLDRNDGDLINRATLINEAKQAINKATK